jgi:hypothetical protein
MVKKWVDYQREQIIKGVTLSSWKNPSLMYHDNIISGEKKQMNSKTIVHGYKLSRKAVKIW